jgi:DNA ligase-1
MQLSEIVETSRRVAGTASRTEKIEHLVACLRATGPADLETAVAFLSGELPRGRIGVGPALLRQAMSEPPAPRAALSLAEADAALERVERAAGAGSAGERLNVLRDLFGQTSEEERRFLAPLLLGELRQGALEGLMVEALARAAELPVAQIRRAFMVEGNLGRVARAALAEESAGLSRFTMRIFVPLKPMLASTAKDVSDALAQLGEAALEYKLDGARVQVHKREEEVRVFTRRLNEVTGAVPEVVEAARAIPAREIVLDGEALAFRADGRPHPFQVTMRRFGRKLEVERHREILPLRPFFFDCLLLEGDPLVDRPARERFDALRGVVARELLVPRVVTSSVEDANAFLSEAVRAGHEGLMAKSLDGAYAAGARGAAWLKLKPARTLDLVVLAAEWGHGRRRGWLSNLHLGARDAASGQFVMLGKTFKGLTDATLAWQTEKLLGLEVARDPYAVYVRPELVVEVAFNEIQSSPQYPAGMALRFARVRRYRPDKTSAEADTIDAVRAIHGEDQRPAKTGGPPG